jgi:hypothetical protein
MVRADRDRVGRSGVSCPPPGGSVPPCRPVRQDVAAYPGVRHLGVEFGGQFVEVVRVGPGLVSVVAHLLGFAAQHRPPLLHVIWFVGVEGRFCVQVPALAALSSAERLGPLGTRRAGVGERVTARDQDLGHLACIQVGAPQLNGPDATAMLDRQIAHDVSSQRHRQPLGSGQPRLGHSSSATPGAAGRSSGSVVQETW